MKFNKRKLLAFCKLFGHDLCSDENVVTQTFTDNLVARKKLKERKKQDPYAKVRFGGIKTNAIALGNLNKEKDVGVFFVVNKTDGKGRKLENIIGVNAIWCEFDGGTKLPKFPIKPTVIVESSKGKYHLYWSVNSVGSIAKPNVVLAEFGGVQARMVHSYDSDPNAKDVSRVLRLPGFYHKKNANAPFMVSVVGGTGEQYTWEEIKTAFPPYVDSSEEEPTHGSYGVDGDEFFGMEGLEEFNLDKVKVNGKGFKGFLLEPALIGSMLDGGKYIDPDCDYNDWLRVGIALHNLSHGGKEGFNFWVNWSMEGSKFGAGGEKMCAQKWKSFSKGGIRGKNRTVGLPTLLWMAEQGGFHRGKIDVENADTIRAEFMRKKAYLNRTVVKAVHGRDLVFIRKIYNGKAHRPEYQTLNSKAMGAVINSTMEDAPYLEFGDDDPEIKFLKPMTLFDKRGVMCVNRYMTPIPGLMADKNDSSITLDEYGGLNTYLGLNINSRLGETTSALEAMKVFNFIHDKVLCGNDPAIIEYMRNWWAFTLQKPQKKAIVMPVLQGLPGTGKGTIIEMFVNAFGQHATTITSEHRLASQFNSGTANTCLVYLNELSINTKETWSMVKGMLSDEDMEMESKGVDSKTVATHFNMVLSTNNERVVITEDGDRRLFYLNIDDRFVDDKDANKREDSLYWEVIDMIDPAKACGGDVAFINQFLERDISKFDPKKMPSMHKRAPLIRVLNKVRGSHHAYEYLYDIHKNNGFPLTNELGDVIDSEERDDEVRVISKEDYEAYVKYAKFKGDKYPITIAAFSKLKSVVGIHPSGKVRDDKKIQRRASGYPKNAAQNEHRILKGLAKKLNLDEIGTELFFENGSVELEKKEGSFALEFKKELLDIGVKKHWKLEKKNLKKKSGAQTSAQQDLYNFRLRIYKY